MHATADAVACLEDDHLEAGAGDRSAAARPAKPAPATITRMPHLPRFRLGSRSRGVTCGRPYGRAGSRSTSGTGVRSGIPARDRESGATVLRGWWSRPARSDPARALPLRRRTSGPAPGGGRVPVRERLPAVRARPGRPPPQWIVGRRARTHGSNNYGDYDAADRSSSGHRRAHRPTRVHPAASRRRVFLCADDAHDPFQRALEIYLRRLDTIDVRTEAAWMRVVVRNTALAVRKSRSQLVGSEDVDSIPTSTTPSAAPRSASRAPSALPLAEALRQLKPDEARALLLKAEGLSYGEMGEQSDGRTRRCGSVLCGLAGAMLEGGSTRTTGLSVPRREPG